MIMKTSTGLGNFFKENIKTPARVHINYSKVIAA